MIVGFVRSMLIPVKVFVAELPATSVAVPVALWFAPSVNVVEPLHEATPESASAHVNDTPTGTLNHPNEFGEALSVPLMVGGVLSMLTLVDANAVLPALSTAVPETAWLAP